MTAAGWLCGHRAPAGVYNIKGGLTPSRPAPIGRARHRKATYHPS